MSICDNAKDLAPSRLYVALTKIFTIIASSICSYVLFVGLDSNSSRFELIALDTSPILVINDTKSLKLEHFPL